MSHGSHADHEQLIDAIRGLEAELDRPTTIVADLQGPKLRVGKFKGDRAELEPGQRFVFDRDDRPGDSKRASLPHREVFEAVAAGARLLVDDGKLVFRIDEGRRRPARDAGRGRRNDLEQQGPQPARRAAAARRSDRQGPRRPRLRARARRRLGRLVLRPAARGRRRGEAADRRQGPSARQDREAGGDRAARGHIGAGRRGDGGARRPRRRAAARGRAAAAETDRRGGAAPRQAGRGGDPDARIDDPVALADPRRSLGRRHRGL